MKDKINGLIADKLGVEKEEVTPTSKFGDDLGADSLDVVEIVMDCEIAFNIHINDDKCAQIQRVSDLYNVVKELTE